MTRKVTQDHAAQQWFSIQMLLVQQQEQIELLTRLLARSRDPDNDH